jgi:hypothetical protein
MATTLVLGIIVLCFAGVFEAVMDTLQFRYHTSVFKRYSNQLFWNPEISWRNKYKSDGHTPKFLGSTTIFVLFTDAWHFFKMLRTFTIFLGVGLGVYGVNEPLVFIYYLLGLRAAYGVGFQLSLSSFS